MKLHLLSKKYGHGTIVRCVGLQNSTRTCQIKRYVKKDQLKTDVQDIQNLILGDRPAILLPILWAQHRTPSHFARRPVPNRGCEELYILLQPKPPSLQKVLRKEVEYHRTCCLLRSPSLCCWSQSHLQPMKPTRHTLTLRKCFSIEHKTSLFSRQMKSQPKSARQRDTHLKCSKFCIKF